MSDRNTWTAVAVLSVLTLVAGALWWWPDAPSRLRRLGEYVSASEACDLAAGPCQAAFDDGTRVTLDITPRGLPTETPLSLDVWVEPPGAVPEAIELQGVQMNMGLLRVPLEPVEPGHSRATAVVPICTSRQMQWHADVVFPGRTAGFGFAVTPGHNPATEAAYGEFTVQTADGPLSLSDLRGQVVILYFGYTSCPDICPTTLQTVAAAMHSLPAEQQDRVSALMISLDPERDSIEHLKTYTAWFHPRIRGATDSPGAVAALAEQWGVAWSRVEDPDSALGYTLDHDTRAFLVAPDGHMVGFVRHGTSADALARQVQTLLEGGAD